MTPEIARFPPSCTNETGDIIFSCVQSNCLAPFWACIDEQHTFSVALNPSFSWRCGVISWKKEVPCWDVETKQSYCKTDACAVHPNPKSCLLHSAFHLQGRIFFCKTQCAFKSCKCLYLVKIFVEIEAQVPGSVKLAALPVAYVKCSGPWCTDNDFSSIKVKSWCLIKHHAVKWRCSSTHS